MIRAHQVIPDGPEARFTVLDPTNTKTVWHIKIKDAIRNDCPEFEVPRVTGGKKNPTARFTTLDEVCRAGFRECNEGRGTLTLTEWVKGLPVYTALVACWPSWTVKRVGKAHAAVPIFRPLWSTNPERTARELPYQEPPARYVNTQWGRNTP